MAGDWTDAQNDAIVADYFAMLADDIAGRPCTKAEHNRRLQAVIGRPRGSIEIPSSAAKPTIRPRRLRRRKSEHLQYRRFGDPGRRESSNPVRLNDLLLLKHSSYICH